MKGTITFLAFMVAYASPAQLNQKWVEKNEGSYVYCYHKNGRISTEEFHNSAPDYMAQGYAKAFDNTGKEIYYETLSRTGLLSSVRFTYYENGAVKTAEYNAHPDGGIQWYQKITYFDEQGHITNEIEMNDDMRVTEIYIPDTTQVRLQKEREENERRKQQQQLQQEREQYSKDSAAFYAPSKQQLENGSILEIIPHPETGTKDIIIISEKGTLLSKTTEYFVKGEGVHSITRTYYKNGAIFEEKIYEANVWHYRKYSKKGILLIEILNQSVAHSE